MYLTINDSVYGYLGRNNTPVCYPCHARDGEGGEEKKRKFHNTYTIHRAEGIVVFVYGIKLYTICCCCFVELKQGLHE